MRQQELRFVTSSPFARQESQNAALLHLGKGTVLLNNSRIKSKVSLSNVSAAYIYTYADEKPEDGGKKGSETAAMTKNDQRRLPDL